MRSAILEVIFFNINYIQGFKNDLGNFLAGGGETNRLTKRDLGLKINSLLDVDKESWALISVPSVGKVLT